MSIRYSDGEQIESRILELTRSAKDVRAHVAVALDHYDAWPVKYHLTPERSNLMRPFDFSGLDVLELGAGMGAVSRYLAENARSLSVVEGTAARFEVLRERLRDLQNWRGQVANIQDVKPDTRFDVVCVIGVLEYSALFLDPPDGESPFSFFLRKASVFLKPEGVLVLAIENQLGMKYWSGSAEDHTARLFDGISGYPFGKSPRTFSRRELTALLTQAGFDRLDPYFPFPDYKIPTSILSLELLERSPDLAAEIACQQSFRNYGNPDVKYFSDGLALRSVARAGLLADFANSFLFVASRGESSVRDHLLHGQARSGAIGWYFSNHRRVPTVTLFTRRASKIQAEKLPLLSGETAAKTFASPEIGNIQWSAIPAETVAEGISLREVLIRYAYFDDWKSFLAVLRAFIEWSFRRWKGTEGALCGESLDAIYVNAVVAPGQDVSASQVPQEFVLFDREWIAERPVAKSWFIFRNVFNLVRDEELLSSAGFSSFGALYEKLCRDFDIAPTLEEDMEREATLQAITSNQSDFSRHYLALEELFARSIGTRALPRSPVSESGIRTEVTRLYEENQRLHAQLSSLPHKITEKLRKGVNRVPGASRAMRVVAQPLYGAAKRTRQRLSGSASKRSWLPVVARKQSFELPRGSSDIPAQGFVRIECRGDFSRAQSGEVIVRFRAEGHTTASLRIPMAFVSSNRAEVLLRDIGEVDSLAFVFGPAGSVSRMDGVRVRGLARSAAVARLFQPLVTSFAKEPKAAGVFASQLLRIAASRNPTHAKLWLKEQLFRLSVPPADRYTCWVETFDTLSEEDRAAIRERVRNLAYLPLISIVMPTYNTDERWLRAAIESVLHQLYPNWELCISDDCSSSPRVKEVLEEYRAKDPRIRTVYREKNGHISAASNSALAIVSGEFTALLDHDDELSPHALYMVAEELNAHPEADLIYSDEDKIDTQGRRYAPHFKPEWNPELFYSLNMVTHLAVFRSSILREIGGFREGFEGSQDYDLTLRAIEKTQTDRIRHIPHILYHWRAIPGSVALAASEKGYAHEAARRAIRSHLERRGVPAEVVEGFPPLHRVIYPLPEFLPVVTAIICTRDRRDLLEVIVRGLFEETEYPNLELIIVDNESTDPDALDYFRQLKADSRVRILRYGAPFNFSAMNNFAAGEARSDLLLFLNNDLEVIEPTWLKEMVRYAVRSDIGAVGAKLLYPDERVQHAGVVLGIGGVADHVHRFLPRGHSGYFGRASVTMAFSAVTAACLLVRKTVFDEVGGFDEVHLGVAYNDVDLCLKIRERGYRNIWTPFAELYHKESASRGSDQTQANLARFHQEAEVMKRRWGKVLENDPAYNPNLSLSRIDFSPAFPPRVNKPWRDSTPAVEKRNPRTERSQERSPELPL